MSWIADKYNALKLAWQRFERWERVYLLREPEWRIPVEGTHEDFQKRLADQVTLVSKKEFFKRYKKWRTTETLGFCEGDEFGLKLPNSPKRLVHYLHGIFVRGQDFDYAYGQYRFLYRYGRNYLHNFHWLFSVLVFLLVSAVAAFVAELMTDAPAMGWWLLSFFLISVLALGPALFALPFEWLSRTLHNARNRQARDETYRLLQEICSRPSSANSQ